MKWMISQEVRPLAAAFVFADGTLLGRTADPALAQDLDCARQQDGFAAQRYEVSAIHHSQGKSTLLVGLGDRDSLTPEVLRRGMAALIKALRAKKRTDFSLALPQLDCPRCARALGEAAGMTDYRYDLYRPSATTPAPLEGMVDLPGELVDAFEEGVLLAQAANVARDLVNEPSNHQTPRKLAEETVALGQQYGFAVEVLGGEEIRALGMEALWQVSKGSPNEPVLLLLRHQGDPANPQQITGLIGKGVTYDSGGLNLKRGERFITMKHDMAGGATVIGAMCAIAARQLSVNVTAIVAACENLIDGDAYKPGDIIGSMGGKTIQINSTDAEGRLTLIDAMTYAVRNEKVTRMVDIGTLTGAARRMLGDFGAPYVANDSALAAALQQAADETEELLVRMPLVEDAMERLRCPVADLVNTALAETGGMITASLFLREFTEGIPWAHIDAAGPLWLDREIHYLPKGGSGWGVRTLYRLAAQQ